MSHNSLPNNLTEVCDGIIAYINNRDIDVNGLMEYIKGPDFPLGGTLLNAQDIKSAYENGVSKVSLRVRGNYEIKNNDIIFNSIPYRTYRNQIKEQINKNIDEFDKILDDFYDESNVGQNRLVFKLKKGIAPEYALDIIFNLTELETTLSYNMNFIVNGTPKLCSLRDLIESYVNHQINIIIKATEYDKDKAEKRLHILEGLKKAIDVIDKVIELIKKSNDKNDAETKLISFLSIDKIQANAILDMKLSRLTKLDKNEIINEIAEKKNIISRCNEILTNPVEQDKVLIQKVTEMKNKYGDERRTELLCLNIKKEKKTKEKPVVEPEKVVVVLTEDGAVKRIPATAFKVQNRNTKGVKTQSDIVKATIRTNTVDPLLVFSNLGKAYRIPVNDIPVGNNSSAGQLITTLVKMENNEKPCLIYSIYKDTEYKYIVFITKNGLIKKTPLSDFSNIKKKGGTSAIKLQETDEISTVLMGNEEDIILVTESGMGIRFSLNDVSSTGRTSMGVKGINLKDNDRVAAGAMVRDIEDSFAIFVENGLGKKISLNDIGRQNRGGKGIILYKNSKVVAASMINNNDMILINGNPNSICISGKDIPTMSRMAVGNILIKGSKITSVSKV